MRETINELEGKFDKKMSLAEKLLSKQTIKEEEQASEVKELKDQIQALKDQMS